MSELQAGSFEPHKHFLTSSAGWLRGRQDSRHLPVKYPYIDALRGMACFGVMVAHTGYTLDRAGQDVPLVYATLAGAGPRGVQLFYIISALTLFMSLASGDVDHRNKRFFLRRFFRIAPLFYTIVLFNYFILRMTHQLRWTENLGPVITSMLFVNGIFPYWIDGGTPGGWSIAVEMCFYMMVPFVFDRLRNLYSACVLATIATIGSTVMGFILLRIHIGIETAVWQSFLFFWLPSQIPVFCIGFVLYFAIKDLAPNSALPPATDSRRLGRLLLIASLFFMVGMSRGSYNFLPNHVLYSLPIAVFVLALSVNPAPLFVNRYWCYMGKISFSVYLVHFFLLDPVAKAVFHLLPPTSIVAHPSLRACLKNS